MSGRTRDILFVALLIAAAVTASVLPVAPARSAAADEPAIPTQSPAQPAASALIPLFDCYRSNSAWGFTLTGQVVDVDGRIWTYRSQGKSWLPNVVQDGGARFYDEADLHAKYTDAKPLNTVDAATLAEKAKLLEAAAAGSMTIADGGARDAGYSGCHAYVRDAAHRRYRDVDLGSDGGVNDTRVKNESEAAQQLLAWLQSIKVAL